RRAPDAFPTRRSSDLTPLAQKGKPVAKRLWRRFERASLIRFWRMADAAFRHSRTARAGAAVSAGRTGAEGTAPFACAAAQFRGRDRKSTRLNSSHVSI